MAKKKKDNKGKEEELAVEKTSARKTGEEGSESDDEEGREKNTSPSEEKGGLLKKINLKKWWLPGILVFILFAGGAVALIKPDLMNMIIRTKHALPAIDLTNDNLQEESLLPFFIPPSSDLSRGAVRVDLTVIWEGLASVRYKSGELRIRAEVYEYLLEVAGKSEDLNAQKAVMEEEMSGIFKKALGVKDLAIRIKELKFI
jgi:hypothetical protein